MNQPIKILIKRSMLATEKKADLGQAARKMMDNDIVASPLWTGIFSRHSYGERLREGVNREPRYSSMIIKNVKDYMSAPIYVIERNENIQRARNLMSSTELADRL